jgi:hypothetical protein
MHPMHHSRVAHASVSNIDNLFICAPKIMTQLVGHVLFNHLQGFVDCMLKASLIHTKKCFKLWSLGILSYGWNDRCSTPTYVVIMMHP